MKNKDIKHITYIYIVLIVAVLGGCYFIYQDLLNVYNESMSLRLNQLASIYPEFYFEKFNDISHIQILYIVSGILLIIICISYLIIVSKIKSYDNKIRTLNNNAAKEEVCVSLLNGEYGKLDDQINRLKRKNEKILQQSTKQKQEMKDYLENVAHQIKTPITSIRLNEEILALKHDDELLARNQATFKRIDDLLESFLKLSRLEYESIHIDLQKNTLNNLINQLLIEVEDIKGDKHISVDIEDCTFFYDEQWLLEALYNIVKNALEENTASLTITNKIIRNHMYLSIIDDGPGIKEEDINHIFERFYRGTNKKRKGTGIGLALTKEIIERHHGSIRVYNDPGAHFEITFQLLDIKDKVI